MVALPRLFHIAFRDPAESLATANIHIFPVLAMKKFLLKLSLVLVPFAVAVGALTPLAYKTEMRILERDLTCPSNIAAAVVGDSRVEVYFDPDEIPWLRNLGLSGTPFAITAQKARLVAKCNPDMKLIVIDIWPSLFFSCLHEPIGTTAPFGVALIELSTRNDMPPIREGFETRLSRDVLSLGVKHMILGDKNAHGLVVGGFFKNKKSLKFGIRPEYAHLMPFPPPKKPYCYNPSAGRPDGEIVLDHLLEDLSKYNLKIVLTTTPALWIDQRWTRETLEYFENSMAKIASRHNVVWHNWLHEYQDKPEYWADGLHLNDIGAKAFSREKRAILEQYIE